MRAISSGVYASRVDAATDSKKSFSLISPTWYRAEIVRRTEYRSGSSVSRRTSSPARSHPCAKLRQIRRMTPPQSKQTSLTSDGELTRAPSRPRP
jgi:hypothetical protein